MSRKDDIFGKADHKDNVFQIYYNIIVKYILFRPALSFFFACPLLLFRAKSYIEKRRPVPAHSIRGMTNIAPPFPPEGSLLG